MGEIEDFVGCTIKRNLTSTTLNIYQPDLITKTTQGFNKDTKSLMTINNPATPHKVLYIIKNRPKNFIGSTEEIQDWRRIATIPCRALTTRII